MKNIILLFLLLFAVASKAQTICGENGNLIIYSNYDGGLVTINVDANIPNLKIGICTYEPVQVTITGPFASSVTQVIYAGFASTQGNDNCGLGDFPTTITGVDPGIIDIQVAPDAGYDNPNGHGRKLSVLLESVAHQSMLVEETHPTKWCIISFKKQAESFTPITRNINVGSTKCTMFLPAETAVWCPIQPVCLRKWMQEQI
jgi:hypothetical protein